MIKSNAIFKFKKNVLRRYESDYDNGTYYLYNVAENILWAGNLSCKLLLDLLNGEKTVQDVKGEFRSILETDDINAVSDSIDVIFNELVEKGMIEEV